jgi:hypothetical protein
MEWFDNNSCFGIGESALQILLLQLQSFASITFESDLKLREIMMDSFVSHCICLQLSIRHQWWNGVGRSFWMGLTNIFRQSLTRNNPLDTIDEHPASTYSHKHDIGGRYAGRERPDDPNVCNRPIIPLRALQSHRKWNTHIQSSSQVSTSVAIVAIFACQSGKARKFCQQDLRHHALQFLAG